MLGNKLEFPLYLREEGLEIDPNNYRPISVLPTVVWVN